MIENYTDHINQLQGYFHPQLIFKFEKERLSKVYDAYYRFCQENISLTKWDDFNIRPCPFFFIDSPSINAHALRWDDGFNAIGVRNGLIEKVYARFEQSQTALEILPEMTDGAIPDELHKLMFQNATIFLYYHELGHIIQNSDGGAITTSEDLKYTPNSSYSLSKQVKEYDSDEFGANQLVGHIFQYFNRLPIEKQTQQLLEFLVATNLASIFILYDTISPGLSLPITFYHGSHPHCVVRITLITGIMVEKALFTYSGRYLVDERSILKRTFEILSTLLPGVTMSDFFNEISEKKRSIVEYGMMLKSERDKLNNMAGVKMLERNKSIKLPPATDTPPSL
jgi:hypothetical protein